MLSVQGAKRELKGGGTGKVKQSKLYETLKSRHIKICFTLGVDTSAGQKINVYYVLSLPNAYWWMTKF